MGGVGKMILWIDFDELVEAFDFCSENLLFFIDLENNKIISIDQIEEDAEEKLDKINEEKYIKIPKKEPKDEVNIAESFVYEIQEENFELAEKFHEALEKRNPYIRFNELLKHRFREKEFRNQVINWLCQNNLELNCCIIPKIEIIEINNEKAEETAEELKDFYPIACIKCNNKEGLAPIFFLLNIPVENALIDKEVKKILKEKYDLEHFGYYLNEKTVIVASKCPICGSNDIFWDY